MRLLAIALLLAASGATIWLLLGPGADPGAEPRPARLEPVGALAPTSAASPASRPAARAQLAPVEAAAPATPAALTAPAPRASTRPAVDGFVRDRLGAPVTGERVWLLRDDAAFPAVDARLNDYITARTGKGGAFSLSAPDEGPWRLAVGPPGAARCAPSAARVLSGPARAEAIVSGPAALRVTFEGLPADEPSLMLELIALREPSEAAGSRARTGRRRGADGAGGAGGARRGRGGGRRGGQDAGSGGTTPPAGGAGNGARGGSGGGAAALRPPAGAARARLAGVQESRNPGGQEEAPRGRRRDRAAGGAADAGGGQDEAPAGPPPEVWRALERRAITADERATGVLEIGGLQPGSTVRLGLRVGGTYLEGQARFVLGADTRVEVRVFPVSAVEGAGLNYVAVPRPLAADESPVGVRWLDDDDGR